MIQAFIHNKIMNLIKAANKIHKMKKLKNWLKIVPQVLILTCTQQLIKRNVVLPHASINKFSDLDINSLKNNLGIEYLLIDKDNTLTLHKKFSIYDQGTCDVLKNCKNVYGKKVVMLSNHIGWDGKLNFKNEKVNLY